MVCSGEETSGSITTHTKEVWKFLSEEQSWSPQVERRSRLRGILVKPTQDSNASPGRVINIPWGDHGPETPPDIE